VERPDSIVVDVAQMDHSRIVAQGAETRARNYAVRRGEMAVVERGGESPFDKGHRPPRQKVAQVLPQAPLSGSGDTQPGNDGLKIPGYEIYEMLGKGGMGRVYRAKQISLNRAVAIKILNDDLAKHKSFIKRFEKETGALAALNHPNITSIIDRGHIGSTYYFVMEYVEGDSLRQRMGRVGMRLDDICKLVICLCQAIDHAHKRGVIHRDLKPENVLFTRDGILKVADFGLANILAPDKRWEMTRTKVSMGTVNYMAPEQRRDAKHVDHRADIFSLGVMMYEMLVGELPMGRFELPSAYRKDVDRNMDKIIGKMLDQNPDNRPQRAGLVAASFQNIYRDLKPIKVSEKDTEDLATSRRNDKSRRAVKKLKPQKRSRLSMRSLKMTLRHRKKSTLISMVVGAVLLAATAAVGVYFWLSHSTLEESPGDLVLNGSPDGYLMEVVHPRHVKYLSPTSNQNQTGQKSVRFDFLPSSMPVLPIEFLGGNWTNEIGKLIQNTCGNGFAVNQIPAKALFGDQAVTAEGLRLKVKVQAVPASYKTPAGKVVSMEQYLKDSVGGARFLMPLGIDYNIGLGFEKKNGEGLNVLVPLDPSQKVRLLRKGEQMEGDSPLFVLAVDQLIGSKEQEIEMEITNGRARLSIAGKKVFEELAGFPLGFKGYPSVLCQNAHCTIHSVEYSQ
jgi:serine/threonine protein kinase